MSFARKHMYKHGWTEGKGLGRNETGMKSAIKVKIKRDQAGMGHDMAEEFTFQWWDHVFNRAASKIKVKGEDDSESSDSDSHENKTGKDVAITIKKPLKKKYDPTAFLYGRFVSGGLLVDDNMKKLQELAVIQKVAPVESSSDVVPVVSSDSDSDIDSDEERKLYAAAGLPEDELFKRCGGRTAHKGARHGLTASAKLARIECQEASDTSRNTSRAPSPMTVPQNAKYEFGEVQKQKKKKRKKEMDGKKKVEDATAEEVPKKKKKKRSEKLSNDSEQDWEERVEETIVKTTIVVTPAEVKPLKKKKKRRTEDIESAQSENAKTHVNTDRVEKKKKSKKSTPASKASESTSVKTTDSVVNDMIKEKSKKKKRKTCLEDTNGNHLNANLEIVEKIPIKKKKKKTHS